MGKYDNYSVEDCNKCLAELNEAFDKLTKQYEAKEIKRFQYNFNRKANERKITEVKARLSELEKEPVEEKLFGPSDEVIADSKEKGLYTEGADELADKEEAVKAFRDAYSDVLYNQATGQYDDSWQRYIHCKDVLVKLGMGEVEIENLEDEISDACETDLEENKAVKTEDVNSSDTYVYEYYSDKEDAEATANFISEQGRRAEVKQEGEEYAVWVSYEQEDPKQDIIELMWSAVCSNDQNYIKYAFDRNLIEPNTRYEAFNAKNSLIMGALRNKHYDMAELLKSFGEKILKAELPEYKKIMAEIEYEDETTKSAMEESKQLNTFYVAEELYNETHDDKWYELSDDEKAEFYNENIAEINSRAKVEESKSLTEMVQRFVVKQNGAVIDGMEGDSYFSNEDEAIEVAKEHAGAYVERYYYKNEQDAEAREIPEDRFVIWAPEEEYEEYEDIDVEEEETISLLDIALKEVPQDGVEDWGKDNELYFVADTVKLFEALKELEVEIPKSYYENADADDWSNGIDDYLVSLGIDPEEGKGDNTYNWGARLTHDVNITRYETPDGYYVKLEIHRSGDVRGNYTTAFLMKFDADYDFFETVSDVCAEECFRELKHNDKTYLITPNFFSETVDIYCVETGNNWTDVYCTDLDGLEEVIKQPVDESKEIKTESDDDFGILLRELDGQSLYRAHAVKTIDGQDYASYLLKDKNGLGVLSFILPITGTEDIRAKVKAFTKENELKESAKVTPEVQEHLNKLEADLLELPNVTKVEFDTDGYLDGINAPITLVHYEIGSEGAQYFDDVAELKSKVLATLKDNGVKVELEEFEDNDTYFYIVSYSTNWEDKLTESAQPTYRDMQNRFDEAKTVEDVLKALGMYSSVVDYDFVKEDEENFSINVSYYGDGDLVDEEFLVSFEFTLADVKDYIDTLDDLKDLESEIPVYESKQLTEAPTKEDAEYKKLCAEIEFQAEENDFTLTEEDVKAIADKMVADKFFFNHDIMADDKDENAWEEINSLIVNAIEAHPGVLEESANQKVIDAVKQGLSKYDVDNISVDEDDENISVMYHSDKDSFPIVQNICKVVDIDKATLVPELDKLDVGKTFITEDWEDMEDVNI